VDGKWKPTTRSDIANNIGFDQEHVDFDVVGGEADATQTVVEPLNITSYFKHEGELPRLAEEQFRDKLGADYPELRVDSPIDTDWEMITVNGEKFYLDGGPDSNPTAEMKRLQKILDEVEKAREEGTDYNPDEGNKSKEGEKGLGDTTEKPFPRKAKKGEAVKGKYYVIDGMMYQWNGKRYITVKGN
jgi:hypothetical protein